MVPRQRRDCPIRSSVEPLVMAAVEHAAQDESVSVSTYVRTLLIRDLRSRGILTDELLADLMEAS